MTTKFKNIFHTLIVFFLVVILLDSRVLSNFVWTMPELFGDFNARLHFRFDEEKEHVGPYIQGLGKKHLEGRLPRVRENIFF